MKTIDVYEITAPSDAMFILSAVCRSDSLHITGSEEYIQRCLHKPDETILDSALRKQNLGALLCRLRRQRVEVSYKAFVFQQTQLAGAEKASVKMFSSVSKAIELS